MDSTHPPQSQAVPRWTMPLGGAPRLVQAGAAVHGLGRRREAYLLPRLWCLHLYRYRGTLEVNGVAMPIRPGSASIIPPGARIVYHYRGPSRHLYAHFTCASPAADGDEPAAPAMQPLGRRFAPLWRAMDEMIAWSTTQPRRSDARLWDLLWQLTLPLNRSSHEPGPVHQPPIHHPAYHRAVERIEMRLDQRIDLHVLAREVGVSHNHLIRLFRRHSGQTIAGYVRERRVQRARHLLLHSTLPVKSIACAVGLSDLQQFNKTMRRQTGRSPRSLRGER
jgi:AraC-like DNA-binding protein